MTNVIDRQTFVFSFYFFDNTVPSQIQTNLNLRFAADELVLKSISYAPYINDPTDPDYDVPDNIQIWCNVTNDNLIGAFANTTPNSVYHNDHFRINNTFQTGNFILQFQTTDQGAPFPYNPQPLVSTQVTQRTFGIVSLTIEFIKLTK